MTTFKARSIDEYILSFPEETRAVLQQIRSTVKKSAPSAEEKISYGMPAFTLGGKDLVYFAAYKNHIGLYPAPVNEEAFKEELLAYKTGRGSVQFLLNKPMPLSLINKIVKFRIKKNKEKK